MLYRRIGWNTCMIRAYGSLLFLSSECVVGTVLSVDLIYFGGQFAYGEGVAELYHRVS